MGADRVYHHLQSQVHLRAQYRQTLRQISVTYQMITGGWKVAAGF